MRWRAWCVMRSCLVTFDGNDQAWFGGRQRCAKKGEPGEPGEPGWAQGTRIVVMPNAQ